MKNPSSTLIQTSTLNLKVDTTTQHQLILQSSSRTCEPDTLNLITQISQPQRMHWFRGE